MFLLANSAILNTIALAINCVLGYALHHSLKECETDAH